MAFHNRLKEARKAAGYTQEQVANFLMIAKSTYSGYETGKSEPSMNVIANLMRLLSVSANQLWQDEMEEEFEYHHAKRYIPPEINPWNAESQDEIDLLRDYRSLNASGKEMVLTMVRALANDPSTKKIEDSKQVM